MKKLKTFATIIFIISAFVMTSCQCGRKKGHEIDLDGMHVQLPDTLRVGMLNSPTTYFDYRGTPMGYDYELMSRFTKFYGIEFKVIVGGTISEMIQWLDEGKIDVLASPVPVTAEFQDRVLLCGPRNVSNQVLVQNIDLSKDSVVKDVTDLVGREVSVQNDSKYYYRIINLDEEIGGGIKIKTVAKDTISDDDLLNMVWKGEIPLTIVDSDVAEAALSYYPGLDISVKVSLDQYSRWAVASESQGIAKALDKWFADEKNDERDLFKKYYHLSKLEFFDGPHDDLEDLRLLTFTDGRISNYDNVFKAAAKKSGLDWRLIAAIAYVESHFDADVRSWAGAMGIMQVMPRTAESYDYTPEEMLNPSKCVDVAINILSDLNNLFEKKVPDPIERENFILASYNSGPGHILDAIALANKYGLNSQKWDDNVEVAAIMKSKPAYYRDPVVKNGYFRGKETVNFVRKVQSTYSYFKDRT
ncbi:MAG: transglycosylase SLT domain-containing protein [Muribaculaceae bacterium]|nr:transglycosylase SLT domain-containing protein [Muribaculaceae bacterium]MDE6521724.1 transglycosylase SLT domain-containing protein [Muribaculaceae bacterium]